MIKGGDEKRKAMIQWNSMQFASPSVKPSSASMVSLDMNFLISLVYYGNLRVNRRSFMLRGLDSNQRPRDYEPRELPLLHPARSPYYTREALFRQPNEFLV